MISNEKLRIAHTVSGIKIFWEEIEITREDGLNVAIKTAQGWVNSQSAQWRVLKNNKHQLKLKLIHKNFPVTQIWVIELKNNQQISWTVTMGVGKFVHIDEICISCFVNSRYKTWFNSYQQSDFPRFGQEWLDVYLDEVNVSLLGVRFPVEGEFLPSLALETEGDNSLFPFIRNSPLINNLRVIGVRQTRYKAIEMLSIGSYPVFSGRICLFENDFLLDSKIEKLRSDNLTFALTGELKYKPKVLLVNLPWQKEKNWGVRAGSRWPHIKDESEGDYLPFPFFLACATSLLQKNEMDAVLIDAIAEQIPKDVFLKLIEEKKFDYIVAETSIPSFENDLLLLEKIRKLGSAIILCGPNHEIYQPQFLESQTFIDFVLCGEYEFSLLSLMQCIQSKKSFSSVGGLIYRDSGKIIKNPLACPCDLKLLPWPYRETLPMEKYLDVPGEMLTPSVQMMASRGCPFGCQFCLWPQVVYQGRHYRARDVLDVVDEMEYLVKEKGFKSVYFDDDTFNIGRERMLGICEEIKKRKLHKLQWAIMARPDLMDEELLIKFKNAGLHAVKYGVESAVQKLVDSIGKDMDLKKTEKMIRFTQKIGIKVHLTFTFGLPGETWQTIEKTIAWAKKLNPFSVQFSIVTPFPGTSYYETLNSQGLIVSKDFSSYDGHAKSVIRLENLSSLDLEMAKAHAYKVWSEHLKKRRNFWNDVIRFYRYAKNKGIRYAAQRTASYFRYAQRQKKNFPEKSKALSYIKSLKSNGTFDILLIECPPWDVAMPPLGVAYLAASLKGKGYKTAVFDLNIALYHLVNDRTHFLWEQKSFNWWVDEDLFQDTWVSLKESVGNLVDRILNEMDSKCIGMSVNFAGINFAIEILQLIRNKNNKIKIIIGGWAVSDEYMRSLFPPDLFDAFVVGEGENTAAEVIDALTEETNNTDIAGAIFSKKTNAVYKPRPFIMNLDSIPWPTFNEFNLRLYKYPILPLFTSRGCIGRCTFCNDWPFSNPYRFRSASNIIDEIRYHVENNHICEFSFKDLLCNGNINELNALCDLLIDSGLKIGWDSQAIARKEMTYELLCKLRKAGCTSLVYGAESFSNNVLKQMGKIFTKEILERVLRDTHRAGIAALVNIIVGFPGESEDDFRETLEGIKRNRKYINQIGAISVCLVNGNSDLDLDFQKYGIIFPADIKIRAKKWNSVDGQSTYDTRSQRAKQAIDLLEQLGLQYDTSTI